MIRGVGILPYLPDGRVVMQRRTSDAPYAPDSLGLFGGSIDAGGTPDQAMIRELEEETSLKVAPEFIVECKISAGYDHADDRIIYMYIAHIDDLDFEVYEGVKAEAYTVDELLARSDVNHISRTGIEQVIKELQKSS